METLPVLAIFLVLGPLVLRWGPGTHLDFALRLLRRKNHRIPGETLALLQGHEEEFLYGNIAADIIHFKSYGGPKHDCHRWEVIERMEALASTEGERAFILGFLTHLAADTVAHNHFVPYHLARHAMTKSWGHVYWEMAADRYLPESHWALIGRLKKSRTLDRNDRLINAAVRRKVFSLWTNKKLFNHFLLIHSRDRWRRAMARLRRRDLPRLPESRLDVFRRAALERMVLVLQPQGRARLSHLDPSGRKAQKDSIRAKRSLLARFRRKEMRELEAETLARKYLEGIERLTG